ncbi:PAS domain-containing protein [Dongia sp.]|uniref:PAS domain-containing protein n=1 Tax=Dongia sp. TaxID=1977262 RepID=UPI0035AFCA85
MHLGMAMVDADEKQPVWLERAGENVRELYAYWHAKRRGKSMPSRRDIDPIEIPRLLPYLTIVEVMPDSRRYIYRLVGTKEVEIRGSDPTGKTVSEAYYGPSIEEAHMFYDRAVATAAPVYDDSPWVGPDGRYNDDEMLFLPLSEDGTSVSRILLISQCSPTPEFA